MNKYNLSTMEFRDIDTWENAIDTLPVINTLADELPHGSGINNSWSIILDYHNSTIKLNNTYSAMDEHGGYCHDYNFTVYYDITADGLELDTVELEYHEEECCGYGLVDYLSDTMPYKIPAKMPMGDNEVYQYLLDNGYYDIQTDHNFEDYGGTMIMPDDTDMDIYHIVNLSESENIMWITSGYIYLSCGYDRLREVYDCMDTRRMMVNSMEYYKRKLHTGTLDNEGKLYMRMLLAHDIYSYMGVHSEEHAGAYVLDHSLVEDYQISEIDKRYPIYSTLYDAVHAAME